VKDLLVGIVVTGALFSLGSVAFVLVIRGTGVFNFAQGQMLALGAYVLFELVTRLGEARFGVALVLTLGLLGVVGALTYRVVLVHLEGAPLWTIVMALFGLGYILDALIRMRWSSQVEFLPLPFSMQRLELPLGFATTQLDLVLTLASLVMLAAVLAIVYLTPIGLHMRMSAENRTLAAYAGIKVERIAVLSWAMAGALIAFAGIGVALRTNVSTDVEGSFLVAFPAVVVGGLESIVGAIVGSFLLVTILEFGVTYINAEISLPLSYAILLGILLVRPYGLFGARDIVRV